MVVLVTVDEIMLRIKAGICGYWVQGKGDQRYVSLFFEEGACRIERKAVN